MKVCARCGESKPREEFAGRWGRSPFCKVCYPLKQREQDLACHKTPEYQARLNERQRKAYRENPAFAEYRKQQAHKRRVEQPERVAQEKASWAREHPERMREAVRRSRSRYPERAVARHALSKAVQVGLVERQACWCGDPETEAHHHNGYDPAHYLDVVWLCRKHHAKQHRKYPR